MGWNAGDSANSSGESVLPIRLRPDFLVVFEGYAGGAVGSCGDGRWRERLHRFRVAADRGHVRPRHGCLETFTAPILNIAAFDVLSAQVRAQSGEASRRLVVA